jgi:hypothetical protein
MDWVANGITAWALAALLLLLMIFQFLMLKQEIHRLARRLRQAEMDTSQKREAAEGVLASLQAMARELKLSLEETDRQVALLQPGKYLAGGMNMNKRSEALRMAKQGRSAVEIAASLHLPHNEVLLLMKIHHSVIQAA